MDPSARPKGRQLPVDSLTPRASAQSNRPNRLRIVAFKVDPKRSDVYVIGMSDPPSNHDLSERIAVLEERMNTMKSDNSTAIERLRTDIANQKVWIMATIIAASAFVIAAVGLIN